MSTNILFEVTVLNGTTPVTIRMASAAANAPGTQLNNYAWTPLITKRHSVGGGWTDEGILSQASINHSSLTFRMSAAYGNQVWSSYEWTGGLARIFVQTGDEGDFSTYKQVFEGSVSSLDRQGIDATVSLLGPDAQLDRDLLTLEYAGTGGAEGELNIKGKLKPRVIGNCISVDPVLVDSVYWIYQVHAYGTISNISVYEYGQSLDPAKNKGNASDYATLKNMTLVPGEWATCSTLGMFRLGGAPSKRISADVTAGNTKLSDNIGALLDIAGVTKRGSFTAAGSATWSLYATEQMNVGDVARMAASHGGFVLFADGTGTWQLMDFYSTKAALVLNADRSTTPLVKSYKELNAAPPVYKVKVGYDRVFGVHSASEISPLLIDGSEAKAALEAAQAAQEDANQAKADAAANAERLDAIDDDGILDRSDKAYVSQRFSAATAERPTLLSKGNPGTERTAYSNAYDALKTYLTGLSPAYDDTTADTPISDQFYNLWTAFDSARSALYASLANWSGITGTGKPEDGATVGAPIGTNVAGVPAKTVVDNAQTAIDGLKDANGNIKPAREQIEATKKVIDAAVATAQAAADKAKSDLADAKVSLGTDVTAAKDAAKKASDDLAAEVTLARGNEKAITTNVTDLKTTVDGHTTKISDNYTTLTDADKALVTRATALEASVNGVNGSKSLEAKITDEAAVRSNDVDAVARRTASLESTYANVTKLLDNGFFDNGADGWEGFPSSQIVASSAGRANVLRTLPSQKLNGILGQRVYVTSGAQRFKLKVSWRCVAASATYYFGMQFFDANNNTVGASDGTGNYPLGPGVSVDSVNNSGWIDREVIIGKGVADASPYGGTTAIPAGAVYMRPILFLNYNDVVNSVSEVDYFTVDDVTDAQAASAAVRDEALVRAGETDALGRRVNTTEAKLNGSQDSGLAASVRDETNARVDAVKAVSDRVVTVEASSKNIPTPFYVVSRGSSANDSRGAGLYDAAGNQLANTPRGYVVCVFDANNTMIAANKYDTLAADGGFSLGGAGPMASFLNGIATGQTVVIFTNDEPASNRLGSGLVEAMERVGAGPLWKSPNFIYRGAYILVGQAGIGANNGREAYMGTGTGLDAWIDMRFDLLKGRADLSGAGRAIAETNAAVRDETSARTDAVSAVVSRTNTLETSVGNGGNLLSNTDYVYDTTGWNYAQEAATGSGRDSITGSNWWPIGIHPLVMAQENASQNRGGFWWQDVYGLEVGKTYQGSMYSAGHRCDTMVYIDCFNSVNAVIANFTSPYTYFGSNDGNAPLSTWARPFVNFVVPAGTAYVRFYQMKWGTYAGDANSYAWFVRPQLTQVRPGVTAAVPYQPGSGDAGLAGANGRINDEATLRSNADGAAAGRLNTIEAQFRGETDSTIAARIRDEALASTNRDTANANRTSAVEAAVTTSGNYLNQNANFSFWPDYTALPNGWAFWNRGDGNYSRYQTNNSSGGYAFRTVTQVDFQWGIMQGACRFEAGWVVLEADVELRDGTLTGSGLTVEGVASLDFARDPDVNGETGAGGYKRRRFTKLMKLDRPLNNWHLMFNWSGFAPMAYKNMDVYFAGVRPATDGEIKAQKVDDLVGGIRSSDITSRVDRVETAAATATQAVANRTSYVEAQISNDSTNLLRNGIFNAAGWGAGSSGVPPYWYLWSQDNGAYIGSSSRPSKYGAGAPLQIDRNGTNNGVYQVIDGPIAAGWYVYEIDIDAEDGNWTGSGFHINYNNGYSAAFHFGSFADSNGEVIGGVSNRNRKFSLLNYNGGLSNNANCYLMAGWSGFASGQGFLRTIWHSVKVRPATDGEIKAQKVIDANLIARVGINESAVVDSKNKLAAARLELSAVSPGGRAQLALRSDNASGAGVDIIGDVNITGNAGGATTTVSGTGMKTYAPNGALVFQCGIY